MLDYRLQQNQMILRFKTRFQLERGSGQGRELLTVAGPT